MYFKREGEDWGDRGVMVGALICIVVMLLSVMGDICGWRGDGGDFLSVGSQISLLMLM